MKQLLLNLLVWMIACSAYAEVFLSFEELKDEKKVSQANGERVLMRGFLYSKDDGTCILASEPNIRSCCLHKKQQIVVLGDFSEVASHQAVDIEGILAADHEQFILSDAAIIPKQSSGIVLAIIVAIILLSGIIYFRIRQHV